MCFKALSPDLKVWILKNFTQKKIVQFFDKLGLKVLTFYSRFIFVDVKNNHSIAFLHFVDENKSFCIWSSY